MPFSGLARLVTKIFKYTFIRPIKRFDANIRMLKYLGPESKFFQPAPRAIGSLHDTGGKGLPYPHPKSGRGFKAVQQRRLEALASKQTSSNSEQISLKPPDDSVDNKFVIDASNRLEVTKATVNLNHSTESRLLEEDSTGERTSRPLPKSTILELQDSRSIWVVDKVPPGRLDLNKLQELMLNKLADGEYWTPERLAERYKIKAEYAESLTKYLKQVRIIVSPRMKKLLDYVGKNDAAYEAGKHLVFIEDKSLRDDIDKQYDKMFLPEDDLTEDVKSLLEGSNSLPHQLDSATSTYTRLARKPEPLRLTPLNVSDKSKSLSSTPSSDIKAIK